MSQPNDIEDGNLPEARRRLDMAVSALTDPKPVYNDGTTLWRDSLYEQLTEAIPGGQGNASRVPQSSPPLSIDATEAKHEIDTAAAAWEPRPQIDASRTNLPPITVIRLRSLVKRGWRPQDTRAVEQISAAVESWCDTIEDLLNPKPRWHLPNPCPACDVAVVYRKNSAGESVRQPALQIGPTGCICQNCHHQWQPAYFQHLASVLGYELPNGVLE